MYANCALPRSMGVPFDPKEKLVVASKSGHGPHNPLVQAPATVGPPDLESSLNLEAGMAAQPEASLSHLLPQLLMLVGRRRRLHSCRRPSHVKKMFNVVKYSSQCQKRNHYCFARKEKKVVHYTCITVPQI